jgi:hypothetical protein
MERFTISSAFAGALLGLSSLCLASAWTPGGAAGSPGAPGRAGGWRLGEPARYENLTIFPVLSGESARTAGFVTLDEALSSGEAIISEQGGEGLHRTRDGRPLPTPDYQSGASVNQLVLINRGKRPLVLLAGELVSGGKQDRIIAKDRIVGPGERPLPLDVFCVEHGRWSSGTQFAAAKIMVHPSVREKAAVDQKQEQVWDAVRSGTTAQSESVVVGAAPPALSMRRIEGAMASEAPTQSYAKVYNSRAVGVPIDTFVEEIQKRFDRATANLKGERVVGVVVAYGAEVAWSDIFASPEMFDHYWSKLLRSYAIEALARPQMKEEASLDDAREFLRPLAGQERTECLPGVYRWREVISGRYAEIELEALQPAQLTLHRLMIHRTS